MHNTLGDPLPIEMRMLFKKLPVLNEKRPARTCRQTVLIVADRDAGIGGHAFGCISHRALHKLEQFKSNVSAHMCQVV